MKVALMILELLKTERGNDGFRPRRLALLAPLVFLLQAGLSELVAEPCWTYPGFEEYREGYVDYWQERGQIPSEPVDPAEYIRLETFDLYHRNVPPVYLDRIESDQNEYAGMAWGSSTHMLTLNDMYRATGELRYLETNLELARASMDARDEVKGKETFYGVISPAWGSSQYMGDGSYTVHLVHTGKIAWGILEFLHVVEPVMEELGLPQEERDGMLSDLTRALDFHQRSWKETFDESGSAWFARDESTTPNTDESIAPFNQVAALANAHYWSWKLTGNEDHHGRVVEVARYIKNRLPVYVCEENDVEAFFWNYRLDSMPVNNPRQWTQLPSLRGGEDFSHGSLSVTFLIFMAREGIVFGQDDLERLRNTVLHGFARNEEGILAGNVGGDYTRFGPERLGGVGRWLALADTHPSVYQRLLPFFLNYQVRPGGGDIARLLLYAPMHSITLY